MPATLLDGRAAAKQIQGEIKQRVAQFVDETGVTPRLDAVLVGQDPASQVYVRNKQKACQRVGIESHLHRLPVSTSTQELGELVGNLNQTAECHGILVQLPLPPQIEELAVLDLIDPGKDVDGFHPLNIGLLAQGRPRFVPCTPLGILRLLDLHQINCAGQQVVVVGRSDIVGKPISLLLSAKNSPVGPSVCNATVTLCHSRTGDLPSLTRQADIVIAALGSPRFIRGDMLKSGAVFIDVGINRTDDGLVGDGDFDSIQRTASAISPVPGGIGPLTVTMLLQNTLQAARELSVASPIA